MENTKSEPTVKRRKNLLTSKVTDIPYQELYFLYEQECKIKNLSQITIDGYAFAHKYFGQFAGTELKCSDITQDLINSYILHLMERLKPQTVDAAETYTKETMKRRLLETVYEIFQSLSNNIDLFRSVETEFSTTSEAYKYLQKRMKDIERRILTIPDETREKPSCFTFMFHS